MLLCMFPGTVATCRGNWGHSAGELKDAQLVAQAAGPLVSTSLICKLTNAATFSQAQITVFQEETSASATSDQPGG